MNRKPIIAAGTLMGIGMGGFIDGIVFHQILQLHSMLSAPLPQDNVINIKTSMVWDGMFHLLTWLSTAVSIYLLWRALKNPAVKADGLTYWGALFSGWGIFNLVEGIIDHYVLQVHHVVESAGLSFYDHIFLASGIIFIGMGMILMKAGVKKSYMDLY
jgi:uncharacterized membrane protein